MRSRFFLLMLAVLLLLCACVPQEEAEQETEEELVQTEAPTESSLTVYPLPVTVDTARLENCRAAVSLEKGDIYLDENGDGQLHVVVYVYDLYDLVDISRLEVGDSIILRQQEVEITELEKTEYGAICINGGLDQGGYELITGENGVYYETGYSDVKSYYPIGEAVLPLSPDFLYTDSSDLDAGDRNYGQDVFWDENSLMDYFFTPHNTSILIENGRVTAMHRIYVP